MSLFKMTEWQSASGKWYCGCIDNLAGDSGAWYLPARILNISPAEFIELLIKKYEPDDIYYNKETGFFSYSWTDQSKMRVFKNWINTKARTAKFQI